MILTKSECYSKLFEIRRTGVDITEPLKLIIGENYPPIEVINFISKYNKLPIKEFYENLRKKCNNKKSKLYKEILDENSSIDSKVKSLSSYITQVLISCEHINDKVDRVKLWESSGVSRISDSLSKYFDSGDSSYINNSINFIRNNIKSVI